MKLVKPLTVLSLSAILSVGAYAEQAKQKPAQPKPVQQKVQPAKTQPKPATKPAPKNTAKAPVKQLNSDKTANTATKSVPIKNNNSPLIAFSKSVELKFGGVRISQQNNQTYVSFSYALKNKAKRSIKEIHWSANYIAGNQVILAQDVPVSFKQPIKPNQSIPLTFSVAWESLPAVAQQVFATQNAQISALFQAKSLTFSNNRKIVVE